MRSIQVYLIMILLWLIPRTGFSDSRVQEACAVSPVMEYHVRAAAGMKLHWEVVGGIIVSDDRYNDTIRVQWNGIGEHRLSVYGEYQGCFTDKRDLVVRLKNPPIVNLGPDIEMCAGQRYTFEVDTGYASVEWQDGSVGLWYTADRGGDVWVKVKNSLGCEATDTVKVLVHDLPPVYLGPDTMLCGNALLTLNAFNEAQNAPIFQWNVADAYGYPITSPQLTVAADAPGQYWVKVTDANNCTNYDTVVVNPCNIVITKEGIPTVFTPNGDGKNDVWRLDALTIAYPNAIVEVYDRWGRQVFRSERGYPVPWNGRDKGTGRLLPMNNYFYIIYPNKKGEEVITGTITIAR
ncbi:MAG TPA: gliding motility-associated C-terminal domain-containing protein [Bacteroidales bacterium]|nr:gliding motility-associated C-terminal domain-containing protein [Bacteroidales bacterium]